MLESKKEEEENKKQSQDLSDTYKKIYQSVGQISEQESNAIQAVHLCFRDEL